jgi:uncharacterized membrane protein
MKIAFQADSAMMFFTLAGCLLALWMAYKQWRYSHLSKGKNLFLIILRLAAVFMIALSLLKPEIISIKTETSEPEVLILQDVSDSMDTRDLVLHKDSEDITVKRSEWLQSLIDSKFYKPLQKSFQVFVKDFATIKNQKEKLNKSGTDINNALKMHSENLKNLRAIILFSDGDWNTGVSPIATAAKLRAKGVPIFSVPVGSPYYLPDLVLNKVKVPAFCLVGEKISIPFQIENRMNNEFLTKITLRSDFGTENTKDIVILPHEIYEGSILWQPKKTELYNLTLEIPVQPGELIKDNNSFSFSINVKREDIRVLLVDSLPRWEYRYLLNALRRDPGVKVNALLFHPGMKPGGGDGYIKKFPDQKKLSTYDVIFIGDVGLGENELSSKNLEDIAGVVKYLGTGLVLMPGYRGRQQTFINSPMEELNPVISDDIKKSGIDNDIPSHLELTRLGNSHFLLMLADSPDMNNAVWKKLPGFSWNAAVQTAAPGADVLAVHAGIRSESGRMPLIAVRSYGQGNVLFMGIDSAWKWRKGVEDKYHYRFWGQVVRWMAHKRHLADKNGIRCFYVPESPEEGNTVSLFASVYDSLNQAVEDADVQVEVSNGQKDFSFNMIPQKGKWGVYKGSFIADKNGEYNLKISSDKNNSEMQMQIKVGRIQKERIGRPVNMKILQDLSAITAGEVILPENIHKVLTKISSLPKRNEIEHRIQLWAAWWWGAIILLLLTLFWITRKIFGLL